MCITSVLCGKHYSVACCSLHKITTCISELWLALTVTGFSKFFPLKKGRFCMRMTSPFCFVYKSVNPLYSWTIYERTIRRQKVIAANPRSTVNEWNFNLPKTKIDTTCYKEFQLYKNRYNLGMEFVTDQFQKYSFGNGTVIDMNLSY